jgi:hypothetical protein
MTGGIMGRSYSKRSRAGDAKPFAYDTDAMWRRVLVDGNESLRRAQRLFRRLPSEEPLAVRVVAAAS